MKNKFRAAKIIISALVVMALIFSFSAVALADGNAENNGGPGPKPSSEEGSDENREKLKNAFASAIKAELAELKELRKQIRESHQANMQLRQQIQERRQELKDIENLDLDKEKLERLRNAIGALKQEARQNRNKVGNFREGMARWRENRDKLNIPRALENLNALQARYRALLESQNEIANALSVVLAHLESI